jgi:hypothetical protein
MEQVTVNKVELPESALKSTKTDETKVFEEHETRISQFCRQQSMSLDDASIQPESMYKILDRNDLQMQIRSTKVLIYPSLNSAYHAKKRDVSSEKNLELKSYAGFLTNSAKKKIKKKLDVWINTVKVFNLINVGRYQRARSYITFLTLTLPSEQRHEDQVINKTCFTPFMDKVKYHFEVYNYFWRAERQENGNIHYHILLDTWIDREKVQQLWNETLEKLNYISEFQKKHHHRNPPTTWIKALPRNSSAVNYFAKYALKQDEQKKINGRVWLASKGILNLRPFTTGSMISIMTMFRFLYERKDVSVHEQDNCLMMCFPSRLIFENKNCHVLGEYKTYMLLLYHILYRDRHKDDKSYEFKQYYPLDTIDMDYLGNLRRLTLSERN